MEGHYTYLSGFIADQNWQKFATAVAVGAVLCLIGKRATKKISNEAGMAAAIVPAEKITTFGVLDLVTEKFIGFHDSVLGAEARKHIPFTLTLFLFIFISNLLGLIPGVPALTTTVWVNVAMALIVFFYFNREGIRENGVIGYIKHFCGPVVVMAPLIFLIEVISTCMRILTLNLRLYWNITADHLVLGIFSDMVPLVPVIFYALGTFVAFMQAFVFTILTMIYIMLATQHGEEHHEAEHH